GERGDRGGGGALGHGGGGEGGGADQRAREQKGGQQGEGLRRGEGGAREGPHEKRRERRHAADETRGRRRGRAGRDPHRRRGARWPPMRRHTRSAESAGTLQTNHAAATAASLAPTSTGAGYGSCTSRRSAPDSFSWPSTRIATNGNSSVTPT